MSSSTPAKLIIARHANTFEPKQVAYWVGRKQDLPLSKSGRAQLPLLASRLKNLICDENSVIVSSPLLRAKQTAQTLSLKIQNDDRLTELDYGPWSGLTNEQITANGFASELTAWRDESTVPECWRVNEEAEMQSLSSFLKECSARPLTVAVSSNGKLKLLGKLLDGAGAWNVKTAHFCELIFQDGKWRITRWNE